MKYTEKLIIVLVLFLIVTIATGAIIGNYVKTKRQAEEHAKNSIILETINLF